MLVVYVVPAEELPLSTVSTAPVTVELAVSICKIWFLTGTISFELGIANTLICVLVAPSTFEILVIFADVKTTWPFV